MRINGRAIGVVLGVAAVATVITVGTLSSASAAMPVGTPAVESARGGGPADLKSVLVPKDEEAPGSLAFDPVDLAVAASGGAFGSLPGMKANPDSCLSFVGEALGAPGTFGGWMQYGSRDKVFFMQAAAKLSGPADVDEVRRAVDTCATGTLTLEGRITGDVTFTEVPAPAMEGATTYIARMTTVFPKATSFDDAALLDKYHFHGGNCPADYVFVAMGDTLIWSIDPDPQHALQAAQVMHDRALAASR